MSVDLSITLDGADELEEYFNALSERLQEVVTENIAEIAAEGLELAKDLAPVRTGFLRDSITLEQTGDTDFQLFTLAPYAVYQEFGTGRIEAKLFMTTAWEFIVDAISDRVLGAEILEE